MKKVMSSIILIALLSMLLMSGCTKKVEAYPSEAITVVNPYAVGGMIDVNLRIMSKYSEKYLGVPMVIVNKPGGGGMVAATEYIANEPDDYNIIVGSRAWFTTFPLTTEMTFGKEDFEFLHGLNEIDFILYVNPEKSNINSFEDLIAYGKDNTISFGGAGVGSDTYLMAAALFEEADVNHEIITYTGAEQIPALLGGHIDVAVTNVSNARQYVETGELMPLAIFRKEDFDFNGSNVPSVVNLGYDIDFTGFNWLGIKQDTSDEAKLALKEGILKIYNDPEFRKEVEEAGIVLSDLDDKGVNDIFDSQIEKTKEIAKILGL